MNKARSTDRLNSQIRAEATDWLLRFSEGEVDAASREDFNRWLRSSPEHVRAYLRICAFWQDADRIEGRARGANRDIDALVRLAQREANVVALDKPGAKQRRSVAARFPLAAAATVLAVVGATIAAVNLYQHAPTYVTGTGELRTVNLPDGSTVTINARSQIKIRFTERERAIELTSGQALFRVAHSPSRPFIVRSGAASVRAVGTQFDVYKKDVGTVVTVVEGRVAVLPGAVSEVPLAPQTAAGAPADLHTPTLLSAGEQAIVTLQTAHKSRLVHPEVTTAWTEGMLVFEGASLAEVAREFNRQNARPLVITGADLEQLRISGTFPANGAGRIVRFLQERFGVSIDESDDAIRIARP